MRNFRTLAAILALLFFANLSWAQGTITFFTDYPQKGSSSGEIAVAGSVTPDCGWDIMCGGEFTVRVWQSGGVLSTTPLDHIPSYSFDGVITGLTPGATYNVTVEVTLVKGCDTVTIVTDPGSATAK